jgi:hypothetical protein
MRSRELGHSGRPELAMSEQITIPTPLRVDPALLDGAVLFLNRAIHVSGLELAMTVSAYVTETFFGGDAAALSRKDPQKTASFRALCERDDLQMGASTLHRLVRIGLQARHLPTDLAERLTLGHHRALLPVENTAHKQHLARLAVQHAWSADKLRATIAAEQPLPGKHPGRPKKPEVLKWLVAVRREVTVQQDVGTFAAEFAALPADEQLAARAEMQAMRQRLDDLLVAVAG